MRDHYWDNFVDLGHQIEYLTAYKISTGRFGRVYSGFWLFSSATGVAALSFWRVVPLFWSVIMFCAQVMEAIKPILQASKQNQALTYILQDYRQVFAEMESNWYHIDTLSDQKIENLLKDFEECLRKSDERFAHNLDFPFKPRFEKIANTNNLRYFQYHFHVKPEEELQ